VDFELDHVRFAGETIVRVIDWDLAGADYFFYDLGTTMSEAVHADGVDILSLAALVDGYQARRALTDWERAHLYEGTVYGTCKYFIWEYDLRELKTNELSNDCFKKVDALRVLGKREFDERLAAARAE
jgi:Ser/Thr protein kinase RdoA (MazF antagonist)